jgi:N-acetyl-1-D-myo-inositol-2-amino-2-deoxy-alpha-D-glucopyranoside deacetylase
MPDAERVLFVHAHPDDETIDTGGTIASLIARGAAVTVLTCTRGERGETMSAEFESALASADAMATLRMSELSAAMTALGVTDHRYLGDADARWSGRSPRRYNDSGMAWGANGAGPSDDHDPASLTAAEFGEVAADVAAVLVDVSPSAIVSYDAHGGYGHPDHIRAHDAARRAAEVYHVPFYSVQPAADGAACAGADAGGRGGGADAGGGASGAGAGYGHIHVDLADVLDRKRAALAAYRSQLRLDGDTLEFPGGQRRPLGAVETFILESADDDEPIAFRDQQPTARFFAAVLGGVFGIALGALLTVYNGYTAPFAGQKGIWIGGILSVVVLSALFVGFRLAFATRIVPGFAAIGAIVMIAIYSFPSGSGSILITQSGPGLLFEIAPPVIAFVVLIWPSPRWSRPRR